MHFLKKLTLLIFAISLAACKKDERTEIIPAEPFATAGTNQNDIDEFKVKLNADSLRSGQSGKWTIEKGLVESKVFFSDDTKADATFNGMPGESYDLKWTVISAGKKFSEAIVKVSFKPLKAIIENTTPANQTKFYLSANKYDKGEWTIEGKYAFFLNQIHGGTVVEARNSPYVEFQGYANRTYKFTWTTYYGSKSASTTVEMKTGAYLETEALDDLELNADSHRLTYENNHIVGLDLSASGIAVILKDTVQYPALQSLVHLKTLNLRGSATFDFPQVIGAKYLQLEYLNMDDTRIVAIADNIGNLKKLKWLILSHIQGGNRISSLPENIGGLENLEYLDLNYIGLQYIPESFSKLTKLKYFKFELNPVVKLPNNLGNMKALEVLRGYTDQDIPASVSKLTNLRVLYFSNKATNPKLPGDFGNLKELDSLILGGAYTELPASFCDLTKLKFIQMTTPNMAALPQEFGNLKAVEVLQIGGLMKTFPDSFAELSNLQTLITGGSLEYLPANFGKLKNLSTLICESGNLKALPSTIGQLSSLETLKIRQNLLESLPAGFFDLPKLKFLELSYNKIASVSNDFSKLSNTLLQFYFYGNNYSPADGIRLKQLLPKTAVYL